MRNQLLLICSATIFASCSPKMEGMTEVKTPFQGNRYESNGRWFRGVGSGESVNLETSKDKAQLAAKQRLASNIQTQIKNVSESYKGERQADQTIAGFNERFQQLTREVMNQVVVEIQTVDEKTYQAKNRNYTTFVALEARKKTVYKKLKELAMQNAALNAQDKKYVQEMIDKAIKDLDDGD